jgi:hypothetical protein
LYWLSVAAVKIENNKIIEYGACDEQEKMANGKGRLVQAQILPRYLSYGKESCSTQVHPL